MPIISPFFPLLPVVEIYIFCIFSLLLQLYKDQRRSCDNVSHKSSDSDVSDVSAISRASSASRISSTSYMSIQSERPRGRLRSETHTKRLHSKNLSFLLHFFLFLIILWDLLVLLTAGYVVVTDFYVNVYSCIVYVKLKYL